MRKKKLEPKTGTVKTKKPKPKAQKTTKIKKVSKK
jgi:hypothetical protein